MELLLWRWSTTAQITSAIVIAIFFVVLGRSERRVELRPWVYAWLANLAALLVTSVFWFARPESTASFIALRWGYVFSKTMFVVLLALGAWNVWRRSPDRLPRMAVVLVAMYAAVASVVLDSVERIGFVQSALIAALLGISAILLLAKRIPGSGWLAMGFALRAALALVETFAYAMRLVEGQWVSAEAAGIFLASHSSFDTGAEWVIALGCVLTLYRTIQQELMQTNVDLLATQEVLQELVDRDSLTGLSNRRALPAVMRESFPTGATVLFFDLNDFKIINDSYGHQVGDECLKRFARALQACFRPGDHVIRYAGDEFVVIAPGLDHDQLAARIDTLRDRLKLDRGGPPIGFSVGTADLAVHGDAEEAIRAADQSMYRDKANKSRKLRAV
ncbi:MAG TPA: GGDEF domain-containing protein [Thermoanaerobaculia bacterium]|nr:GGDEF domain-containing protein [Thermoanaerobaculia bacterium]